MIDLRTQLRAHYEAQSLAPAKVAAILARCAQAAESEPRDEKVVSFPSRWGRRATWLALAAAFVCAGSMWLWAQSSVPYPALQTRVVDFFGGKYDIPMVSQNQAELRAWLIERGAPAEFEVPEKLQSMQAYGCRVLQVRRREAFLMCFWLPTAPDEERALLHLLASRRSDFRKTPSSARAEFTVRGEWTFAAWSEGDITYTLGAKVPPERLSPYVAALRASRHLLASR